MFAQIIIKKVIDAAYHGPSSTLSSHKYFTTQLKIAASSGQWAVLDNFNNMTLARQSVQPPYSEKYS